MKKLLLLGALLLLSIGAFSQTKNKPNTVHLSKFKIGNLELSKNVPIGIELDTTMVQNKPILFYFSNSFKLTERITINNLKLIVVDNKIATIKFDYNPDIYDYLKNKYGKPIYEDNSDNDFRLFKTSKDITVTYQVIKDTGVIDIIDNKLLDLMIKYRNQERFKGL